MANDTLIYNSSVLTATLSASSMLTLTTSASNCWQGNYVDFGATRAELWLARMACAFSAAPAAGGQIEFYIAWSSATATAANFPGGCTGADGNFPGQSGVPADGLKQLTFVGSFDVVATGSTALQIDNLGTFRAEQRYGVPVLAMRTSTILNGASASFSLTFHDIRPQLQ